MSTSRSSYLRSPTYAPGRHLVQRCLPVAGAGLLLFWLIGGFPPTTWRLLFQAFVQISQSGLNTSGLFALAILIIQSLCIGAALGLLVWVAQREIRVLVTMLSQGYQQGVPSTSSSIPPVAQMNASPGSVPIEPEFFPASRQPVQRAPGSLDGLFSQDASIPKETVLTNPFERPEEPFIAPRLPAGRQFVAKASPSSSDQRGGVPQNPFSNGMAQQNPFSRDMVPQNPFAGPEQSSNIFGPQPVQPAFAGEPSSLSGNSASFLLDQPVLKKEKQPSVPIQPEPGLFMPTQTEKKETAREAEISQPSLPLFVNRQEQSNTASSDALEESMAGQETLRYSSVLRELGFFQSLQAFASEQHVDALEVHKSQMEPIQVPLVEEVKPQQPTQTPYVEEPVHQPARKQPSFVPVPEPEAPETEPSLTSAPVLEEAPARENPFDVQSDILDLFKSEGPFGPQPVDTSVSPSVGKLSHEPEQPAAAKDDAFVFGNPFEGPLPDVFEHDEDLKRSVMEQTRMDQAAKRGRLISSSQRAENTEKKQNAI